MRRFDFKFELTMDVSCEGTVDAGNGWFRAFRVDKFKVYADAEGMPRLEITKYIDPGEIDQLKDAFLDEYCSLGDKEVLDE